MSETLEIGPAKLLNVRIAGRNSGVLRSGRRSGQRGKAWSDEEIEILKNNRKLSARQLIPLLPNRTHMSIRVKRQLSGWTYIAPPPRGPRIPKGRKLKRVGHPIIDAIITRCEEDGIGLRNLDREIGSGLYFQLKTKRFSLEPIAKAIAFFGGRGLMIDENANVTIDWNDE
jgi:hypothetical protein